MARFLARPVGPPEYTSHHFYLVRLLCPGQRQGSAALRQTFPHDRISTNGQAKRPPRRKRWARRAARKAARHGWEGSLEPFRRERPSYGAQHALQAWRPSTTRG